jgi:hypothetical protein
MANTLQHKEIGGEGIHVRDCYVWTEISFGKDGLSSTIIETCQRSFGLAGSCFLPARRPDRMSALLPGSAVVRIARERD